MEFTTDWIVDGGQLCEPALQIIGAHSSVAAFFGVPVDSIGGRQRSVGLPYVIVDCAQSAHASICHVGTVPPGDLVVLPRHASRIFGELTKRSFKPARKDRST